MKTLLIAIFMFVFSVPCFADTTLSRDGDGQKMQSGAFSVIISASLGTKGFKCYSALGKISWWLKTTATATTDGSGVGFKMFYNGSETLTFPVSDMFGQWMNSPVSKAPTITSVCLRAYSTATLKTAHGLFQ